MNKFTRRDSLTVAGASLVLAAFGNGCTNQNPTTQPSPLSSDEQAFQTAAVLVTSAETILEGLILTGVLKGNAASQAKTVETAVNAALSAWGKSLNTGTAAELEAALYAILPGLLSIIAGGKTAKARKETVTTKTNLGLISLLHA